MADTTATTTAAAAAPDESSLLAALEFVHYAYKGPADAYSGAIDFEIHRGDGSVVHKVIAVEDGSVAIHDDPQEGVKCHVKTSKDVLVALFAGTLEPMMAMMGGMVVVDDLNELVAFSKVFDFDREKFDEFKQGLDDLQATEDAKPAEPAAAAATDDGETQESTPAAPAAFGTPAELELDDRLKVSFARFGLSVISSVAAMTQELDKLSKTPAVQGAIANVNGVTEKITKTEAVKSVSTNPTVAAVSANVSVAATKVTETSKTAGLGVVAALSQAAQPPTVESKQAKKEAAQAEKAELEDELARLKRENREKAERRKARREQQNGSGSEGEGVNGNGTEPAAAASATAAVS